MKRVSVRVLAVLAAVVLLLAAVPMAALAADTPLTLVPDIPQTVEVSRTATVLFTYTASEAGTYIFRSQAPAGTDPVAQQLDENGQLIQKNDDSEGNMNFRLDVTLAAGETCTFLVSSNHKNPKSFSVVLARALTPAGVEMLGGEDEVTLSLLEQRDTDTVVSPQNVTVEEMTYTSADKSVVTVSADGMLTAVGAGTTTVTVTVDGTLTDTVTVHVRDAIPWGTAEKKDVILTGQSQIRTYSFTVSAAGRYEIFSEGNQDPYAKLYEKTASGYRLLASPDDENEFNFALTRTLAADKTYYLLLGAYGVEVVCPYAVTLRAAEKDTVPETGVGFVADSITVAVGDVFLPEYWIAQGESVQRLTAANGSVVSGSTGGAVTAKAVGNTTLTIETASGATDTIAVTVLPPPVLTPGQKTTVAIDEVTVRHYTVRPAATGTYVLRSFSTGSADPRVTLYDSEWNELASQDDSSTGRDFQLESPLTGGQTYYVGITNYKSDTFEALFAQLAPATAVSLTLPSEDYVKLENDVYYVLAGATALTQAAFAPAGAIEEDYRLQTGDTAIASVKGDELTFHAPGETTVTLTTENGLTDTLRVVVVDYLPGDVTLDGALTRADLAALRAHLRDAAPCDLWYLADYNQDGAVDEADLAAMDAVVPRDPATTVKLTLTGGDYINVADGVYHVIAGNKAHAQVTFGPVVEDVAAEAYTLQSQNSAIVSVNGDEITFRARGETTVTVTSANGLTDTIRLVVQDPVSGLLADADGDGQVTSTDARLVLQYAAEKITADNLNLALVNVDGDGQVTSTDARLILQKVAGKIQSFPAA